MGRLKPYIPEKVYNLSDINWEDETLENGIGDIDGSDPTMKGYNREYEVDPYKQRFYANKNSKTAAKEVVDISTTAENYANEILSMFQQGGNPLQNVFEAFTMNKCDNLLKQQIATILGDKGYTVYPVLDDRRIRFANNNFKEFQDYQLSDESLNAIENIMNGQDTPIYNGPGCNEEATDRDDIGVPPNNYEVFSRLKKNIVADKIESIPYYEVMDAINEASRNVSILLNRKMQIAPQLIKTVRKQTESNENLNNVINIVTSYEIWQIYLEYEKTNMNSCFVIISGDYTNQGYKKGIWSNIKYNGFYSSLTEAENEISGYLN